MNIPDTVLEELKDRMKIMHSTEDKKLKRILLSSLIALQKSCGAFDLTNEQGKELVFERARYVYNDSLEFFADNFLSEIINFSISLSITKTDEEEES